EDAERGLLLGDLLRPAHVPEAAEPVVGGSRGDRVRLPAPRFDVLDRLLPALLEADSELGPDEPHLRPENPREQDVPHPVVHRVRPLDPALLEEDAVATGPGHPTRNMARV